MSWNTKPEFTEVSDANNRPLIGVTGGGRAAVGDVMTLQFQDDGSEIETSAGPRVRFDVVMLRSTFTVVDGDNEIINDDDWATLMTGSARFLSQLAEHMPVDGKTLNIQLDGIGYDSAYTITESE